MSYIGNNLSSDEEIIKSARVSMSYIFVQPISVFCSFALLGLFIGSFLIGGSMGLVIMCGFVNWGLIITIIYFIRGLVLMKTTEIALTNQRVIMKWGLIRRNTIEILLNKVEGMRVDQSFLGRIFDYGSLSVSGTGGSQSPVHGIGAPNVFRKAVNNYLQNRTH